MPVRLTVLRHQIAAWNAGHKKECVGPAEDTTVAQLTKAMFAPVVLTKKQGRLKARLVLLQKANDFTGVLGLEREVLALASELQCTDSETTSWIRNLVGHCHFQAQNYTRACELHKEDKSMNEALGNRARVARACCNLGHCCYRTGDYARARELHEQHRAICEALGDHVGMAAACGNLGCCYHSMGDYVRARELHEQHRAICEAHGDHAQVAVACGNLGCCYESTGDYVRAREMHEQRRAMAEALGDRAGVAAACANLGSCYFHRGDFARACLFNEYA